MTSRYEYFAIGFGALVATLAVGYFVAFSGVGCACPPNEYMMYPASHEVHSINEISDDMIYITTTDIGIAIYSYHDEATNSTKYVYLR